MRTLTNFLAFTFILSTSLVSAQTSETCNQNLSIFAESAKVKNYDAAYEPWNAVRAECPKLNRAIYTYGERILKSRLKNAVGATKDAEAQDLMKLYDQWIENFPSRKGRNMIGSILASKAQTMMDYKLGTTAGYMQLLMPLTLRISIVLPTQKVYTTTSKQCMFFTKKELQE